jgi:hypothetical protein
MLGREWRLNYNFYLRHFTFNEGDEILIDPIVLTGTVDSPETTYHLVAWRKQYEIWNHANGIISGPLPSQQDLAAAVIQLQRAVELRDKLLDQLYNFTKLPCVTAKAPYPIMSDLGIIRPTMKIQLRELRNKLAHETVELTLQQKECELLSDTAWYYLKATDRLTQQCAEILGVSYWSGGKTSGTYQITFDRVTWEAGISGDMSPDLLFEKESVGCMCVRVKSARIENYDGRLRFTGKLTGSTVALKRLIQSFFDESVL